MKMQETNNINDGYDSLKDWLCEAGSIRSSGGRVDISYERFNKIQDRINGLVLEYYRERKASIKTEIWTCVWIIGDVIFNYESLRGYKGFSSNGYNSCGSADYNSFLNDVLMNNIAKIIDSFCTEDRIIKYDSNFMRYFVGAFTKTVSRAASNIIYRNPQNFRWVKLRDDVDEAALYAEPSEDTRIVCGEATSIRSHNVNKRYISQCQSEGGGEWYYIESKQHGRQVYVRACDFDLIEPCKVPVKARKPTHDQPGDSAGIYGTVPQGEFPEDGLTNTVIIPLLSAVQKLYQEKEKTLDDKIAIDCLGMLQCYKLLYTETMTKLLKSVYEIIGENLLSDNETQAIDVSDTDFLDYILTAYGCRTFLPIARTRLKSRYEITQRAGDDVKELSFPIHSSVYYCYLTGIKGLKIREDSVTSRLSRFRRPFDEQFRLLCNVR